MDRATTITQLQARVNELEGVVALRFDRITELEAARDSAITVARDALDKFRMSEIALYGARCALVWADERIPELESQVAELSKRADRFMEQEAIQSNEVLRLRQALEKIVENESLIIIAIGRSRRIAEQGLQTQDGE